MSRRILFIALMAVVVVVAGVFLSRAHVLAVPQQPVAFSHKIHIDSGIQCLFCHSSALRSAVAGIPSVQKCMGCHNLIAVDSPVIQEAAGYWERAEPIPWVRVNVQPDFIDFSHQPHLSSGLNCETCHGDVGRMDVARPVGKRGMGWCLDCHLEQSEPKAARLADCLTCHR
jgi:hypothetical protein